MLLYRASREAIPLFAVYALVFAEHGLSTSQISVLLAVWSANAFLLEVPSGAWADVLDRRRLLIASGAVYAMAFATWVVWPGFLGFLLGFVLWSLSGAMLSGTYEAHLFDQLTAAGRPLRYGPVKARAESLAVVVMAAAIALAGPLHAAGGYALVGWLSVATAALHTLLALALPRVATVTGIERAPRPEPSSVRAWGGSMRAGAREAAHHVAVRRVLLAYATVVALVGFDEFSSLLLAEGGTPVPVIAWLLAGITLLQAAATWAASAVARWAGLPHAGLVLAGGLLLALGAWAEGPLAFAGLAVGYALVTAAYISGDIRLQHAISGVARATTTSIGGLIGEVGFLVTLALIGLGTLRLDLGPVATVVALVLTPVAAVAAYRAPAAPADRADGPEASSAVDGGPGDAEGERPATTGDPA